MTWFMKLFSVLDAATLALVSNLAQHIAQHKDPKAECVRLMKILEPELRPKLPITVKDKTAKASKLKKGG